jgi:hypothetical protein
MKIPDELRIGGLRYRVELTPNPWDSAPSGRVHLKSGLIQIGVESSPDNQRSTLLHEALEVINWSCGLDLEHPKIMALEHAIDALLIANPGLVALYTRGDCGEHIARAVADLAQTAERG